MEPRPDLNSFLEFQCAGELVGEGPDQAQKVTVADWHLETPCCSAPTNG